LPTDKNDYNKTGMKQSVILETKKNNISLRAHFTFSFFLLAAAIKAVLLFNLYRVNPSASFQSVLPMMFSQDALAGLLIFLICDIPWWLSGKTAKTAGIIIRNVIRTTYYIMILYTLLMLNFYLLFGSFLNAGLLSLADNIGSFSGGIFSEFGPLAFGLIFFSFIYFILTEKVRSWSKNYSKGLLTYILLTVYMSEDLSNNF